MTYTWFVNRYTIYLYDFVEIKVNGYLLLKSFSTCSFINKSNNCNAEQWLPDLLVCFIFNSFVRRSNLSFSQKNRKSELVKRFIESFDLRRRIVIVLLFSAVELLTPARVVANAVWIIKQVLVIIIR